MHYAIICTMTFFKKIRILLEQNFRLKVARNHKRHLGVHTAEENNMQSTEANLLIQSCKTDKLTVMSRIELCLSPFKPDRSKNVSWCILQQFIKIRHCNSDFVTKKSNALAEDMEFKQHNVVQK